MGTSKPKSKKEALSELINNLVDTLHSKGNSGLIEPNEFLLRKTLNLAEPFMDADPANYWHLKGLIEANRCNFKQADINFKNAIKLDKSRIQIQMNYLNILLALGKTEEVGSWITDNFVPKDVNYYCLSHLFTLGLLNLDFTTFNKYYAAASHDSILPAALVEQIKTIPNIERMKTYLDELNVSKVDFKAVMRFILIFFSEKTLEVFSPHFSMEQDADSLEINLYLNIDVKTAVKLTNEFESKFVQFALEEGKPDYLSHFAVFFRPSSLLEETPSLNEEDNLCEEVH